MTQLTIGFPSRKGRFYSELFSLNDPKKQNLIDSGENKIEMSAQVICRCRRFWGFLKCEIVGWSPLYLTLGRRVDFDGMRPSCGRAVNSSFERITSCLFCKSISVLIHSSRNVGAEILVVSGFLILISPSPNSLCIV